MPAPGFVRRSLVLATCLVGGLAAPGAVVGQRNEPLAPSRVEDGPPDWLHGFAFPRPFTFVRVRFSDPAALRPTGDNEATGRWATDYPDADLHFCKRWQELTGLDSEPEAVVVEASDLKLLDYPFVYLSVNGVLSLSYEEVHGLRQYLEQGGFLMIDDSWGEQERAGILALLKRVAPDREPEELPLEHKIFHTVYDLTEKPQVFAYDEAIRGRTEGVAWTPPAGTEKAEYLGVSDDDGRLMVLVCHNTDLADGWERVGMAKWYTEEFSNQRAFPMGVNVVFYALSGSN